MRTAVSRLLLVVLIGVAVFALIQGPAERADAAVALEGLRPERLERQSFQIDAPAAFAVDAAGSFEEAGSGASDTTLAAYGWIVRRESGAVVWKMGAARPERGTFVAVRDTLRLPPGTYDAYFASHGDPLVRAPGPRDNSLREQVRAALSRGGRSWVGDAGRWRFVVAGLTPGVRAARVSGPEPEVADAPDADSSFAWRALGVRSDERRQALLQVTAPTAVRVRALTEVVEGAVADEAQIVQLGTRDTVWAARAGEGRWAGGSVKNRVVEAEIALEPGIYEVAFETDRSHAYGDWTANPPLVPWRWGMELQAPAGAVSALDVAALDLPRIAEIACVGPDEEREVVFTLREPADVLAVAVGEVDHGTRYDYGGLDREEADGDWGEVWEMERDGLEPAGGAEKNRRAVAALALDAGTYRLRYETDSSHDCRSGYNSGGGPDAPLWGAVVYALRPDAAFETVGPVPADTASAAGPEVYEVAEVQPELVGGPERLQERLEYPEGVDAEGVVIVSFVVDEEGRVLDPVALRSPDPRLSEAAIAAVREARFWPGRQEGRPVRVRSVLPVTFRR